MYIIFLFIIVQLLCERHYKFTSVFLDQNKIRLHLLQHHVRERKERTDEEGDTDRKATIIKFKSDELFVNVADEAIDKIITEINDDEVRLSCPRVK